MAGGLNLAEKYSKKVDERFSRESQAMLALNNDYEFMGDKTVKVYSIPIAVMNNYSRTGSYRYGNPSDLGRNVQTLTVGQDKAFTFIIDKGDKLQSEMVSDAGKALSRQLREVVVPMYDTYVFKTLAEAAKNNGSYSETAVTKSNAYEVFLDGMEHLGDSSVPDKGRVCFCSYRFANLLKQDPAFMRYGDASQEMILRGVIGEVDGCKIVKVPSNRLPAGAAFILTHAVAATAPKQLEDYKIHDNPPGISGWLVEGRFIFDCFVLGEKANAVWYHGGQGVLKSLSLMTTGSNRNKSTILVPDAMEGDKRYYATAVDADSLPTVTAGTAITTSDWTALNSAAYEITPTATHTVVRVVECVEVTSSAPGKNDDVTSYMPIAAATAPLHIGA